ncbi:MAG: hypothetical protein WD114_00200 [Phycisphaerales bacterium]
MVELTDLWLPILIASFAVFVASSLMWMVLPHHKADVQVLPDEKALTGALGPLGIPPGFYMFPNCQSHGDTKSEEFQGRWKAGPWGTINIYPGQPKFGMNLLKTLIVFLVISGLVAYLSGRALPAGTEAAGVFQFALIAAILGHCTGGLVGSFFMGKPTRFVMTDFIDGVVYALITAAVFAWMWPAVAGVDMPVPTIN